ncbi:MarR family winged helix-turn-helix transcriptional regulator [bacterium]|nr:MarR family winged helix-turn-helix transcriptional regulator [bacterium]
MNDETPKDFNPQLAQLSNFLTYRIARVHQKLNMQATRILHDSVGLTLSQWRVIAFVGGAGEVTASELVKYTAMDKGLVSRNVKSLIESGLVSSSNHANDSRVHVLSLTQKGQGIFNIALPRMRQRQEKLAENVSVDDIAAFRRVLEILEKASEGTGI